MSTIVEDIAKSLRVATMAPLDAKTIKATIEDLQDLGEDSNQAFTYYDGLRVYVLETRQYYEWKELAFGDVGIIPASYAYPPSTIIDGVDYSGKIFNFVAVDVSSTGKNLVYYEGSVNIEYKEEETPIEALYFGTNDIGGGVEDVALVSGAFSFQGGYDINHARNVNAEIKMFNLTNGKYLGHFTITENTFGTYTILNIIEKGDWEPLGDYPIQEVLISVLKHSNYSIELVGNNILLKEGLTTVNTIDLGPLLTTSATTIVSGVLNPTNGIVTFTLSDASTFDVDFSALLTAETTVKRASVLAPNGNAVYANLFVNKTVNAFFGTGFYAADLTTNYNSGNFIGFPYPTSRDYVVCRYESQYYMLIKKTVAGARMFNEPNNVLGMSFFTYSNTTDKHMIKVAYIKILTKKTALANLNSSWYAYPLTQEVGTNFPNYQSGAPFNETYLIATDSASAIPLISLLYKETLPLKKAVTAPYTLTDSDNGLVLFVSGNGAITVPQLAYGFECGFVQKSSDINEITFTAGSGVTITKPSDKSLALNGQYYSAYLISDEAYTFNGLIGTKKGLAYTLLGDLKDV